MESQSGLQRSNQGIYGLCYQIVSHDQSVVTPTVNWARHCTRQLAATMDWESFDVRF
jgi:hypothetical protein